MKALKTSLLLAVAGTLGRILACIGFGSGLGLPTPQRKHKGDYVAEVWLDWGIAHGSTMYRQRFTSQASALFWVKLYAAALDCILLKHYADEDYFGRRIWLKSEFSIRWGIRKPAESELQDGVRDVFSSAMPGTSDYDGEHASAHPALQGTLEGFKV